MRKLKIYLDSSVISHLNAPDAPDKEADTLKLWEEIAAGKYEVYLSDVVFEELNKCDEPKKSILIDFLNNIEYENIELTEEIKDIAEKFIDNGILTNKSVNDSRHIACTMSENCDVILSWNFKHIVNHKTINGVKIISVMTGTKEVRIYTPTILISGGEEDD